MYNPDADETTPHDLRDEMLAAVSDSERQEVAYRVRFRTMLFGRWIKRASLYPTWVVRLLKPPNVSFERDINLTYIVQGKTGRLRSHFEHHTFNKGFEHWLSKHNSYSTAEAIETLSSLEHGRFSVRSLFSRDAVQRRKALKELSLRLPLRPQLRFLYMYVLKLGVLDGRAGLTYCRLLALYEAMICHKVAEAKRRRRGLSV